MIPFDFQPRTRVVFGPGSLAQLGQLAGELAFRRTLLVADRGLLAAGHVETAARLLEEPVPFHDFGPNPDTRMLEAGRAAAEAAGIDSLVGLGGGSSMDCAKGINFLLARAGRPMLPMIGIPTTTGTGSEAQSYALISDAETHVKTAWGDPRAAFRVAILDPCLALSQPREVRAVTGYDAISHAVESWVTTRRTPLSEIFSREAWRLLEANFERVLACPGDLESLGAMQWGAHLAGMAIENSMLGATHACANPLTARYGTPHGVAIASLLPHVVRWNVPAAGRYNQLAPRLPERLEELARAAGLPARVREVGAAERDLPLLAEEAGKQWTGRFNPRPFDAAAALELYRCAW